MLDCYSEVFQPLDQLHVIQICSLICRLLQLNRDIQAFKQQHYHILKRRQELLQETRARSYSNPAAQTDNVSSGQQSAAVLRAEAAASRRGFKRQRSITVTLPIDHSLHITSEQGEDMKMLESQRRTQALKTPLRVDLNTNKLMGELVLMMK